ncbi:DUF4352 domain-containing protein [Haloarculaceae archaeon H-GB2-1]|nr:DUF4352 domain-containing protein [Haloarculaceae archaeon H-GB2-1]
MDRTVKVHDQGEQFVVTDDHSVAFTVTDVTRTRSVWANPKRPPGPSGLDTYLVVTVRMENVGEEDVDVSSGDMAVVSENGNVKRAGLVDSHQIQRSSRYEVPGISADEEERTLSPGDNVTRHVLFEVEADHTYLFTVRTQSSFDESDRHYVPLGRVPETQ